MQGASWRPQGRRWQVRKEIKAGALFIVDNSEPGWTGRRYLEDRCGHGQAGARNPLPDADTVEALKPAAYPVQERIGCNELESRTLATTRDALRPKLLSGDIDVRDDEQIIGRSARWQIGD